MHTYIHSYQLLGQFEEENCYAMGWGKSRFNADMFQQILRDVQLPIVKNDKCEKILQLSENENGDLNLGPDFRLHKSFNCAGYVYNCFLKHYKLIIPQFISNTNITNNP